MPRAVDGLTQLAFTPAALLGFETKLARQAVKLPGRGHCLESRQHERAVHADETYWSRDGKRGPLFLASRHRPVCALPLQPVACRQNLARILGEDFTGVLVTDCYSAYDA